MTTDVEFLDKVTAFLDTETLVPVDTPRKSFGDGFQQLLANGPASWANISSDPSLNADPSKETEGESYKSSSSDGEQPSTKNNKRQSDGADVRRQKHRQRQENERDELRQLEAKLSKQAQEMIEARQGTRTTARTDLALSKTFWRKIVTQQRERRVRVEAEHNRLLAIVNSQGAYIESMGVAVRECQQVFKALAPVKADHDTDCVYHQIDDLKWLRLKSSVSALYTTYLHEVDNSYARVNQVFRDVEIESLPVGVVGSSYKYKPNGDVEYFVSEPIAAAL